MAALKHSTMTLFSDPLDIDSHRIRIALAEKGITVNIVQVNSENPSEDLLTLNPYNVLPTLVDRELVLYNPNIISEYLDERFPHPPLLPVYPVTRAKCRLVMHRIEQDWLPLLSEIQKSPNNDLPRIELTNQLMIVAPLFSESPYFLNEEFSLVDCYLASLFWRLKWLNFTFPARTKAITDYMKRVFARNSFKESLSEAEAEMGYK